MFEQEKYIIARSMTKAGHGVEFIGLVLGVKVRRIGGICFIGNQAIFTCVVCGRVLLRHEYLLRKTNGIYEATKTCSGKCKSRLMNDVKAQKHMVSLTSPR